MFSTKQTHSNIRAPGARGVVDCERCRMPIFVNRPESVSVEFCVPCPHCGHRGIYFKRMLAMEDAAERRGSLRG